MKLFNVKLIPLKESVLIFPAGLSICMRALSIAEDAAAKYAADPYRCMYLRLLEENKSRCSPYHLNLAIDAHLVAYHDTSGFKCSIPVKSKIFPV